jgi:MFS family permease
VISGAGLTPLPFSYVVTEAFDRRRGLALGVVLTISAAAVAILPPVAAQVIDRFGWREAYVMLGIFVLVGGVFIATVLFRSLRAKTRALRSSVALMPAASVPGVTYGKALRSPIFWLLLASLFLASFCVSAGTIPLPAVLSDRGVPPTRAALAFSIIGISMGITRLTVGALLDYLRAPKLTAALLLAPIVGHVLLAQGTAGGEVVVAAACFGIGLGVELDAYAYMVSRAFGVANFGKIYGTVLIAFTAGIATGPSIVSSVFVDTGGFNPGFLAMGAAGVLAAALLFFVKPSAFPYAARGHAPATK